MKKLFACMLPVVLLLLCGCNNSKIITSWKSPNVSREYKKIMVVGIIKDSSLGLRTQMETHLVNDLRSKGYNAVSALNEFGEGGLANLEQEETYIRLCNKGIDAVITIALIDRKKENYYVPAKVKYYSNLYYYNRIWNYNSIQADLVTANREYAQSTQYTWESILFDLQTLSPVYTTQTKTFDPASAESMAHEYGELIVASMLKNKILTKGNTEPLRTF